MRAVPWRLSVKESSRRPAEGKLTPASAFAGSTPSRRIGAALPRMNGAPNRSGRISSGPLRPVGLQCGQTSGPRCSSHRSASPSSPGPSATRQPAFRSSQKPRAAAVGLAAKSRSQAGGSSCCAASFPSSPASTAPPSFSRALSKANSSRGGLRSGADRRGPASIPSRNASPHSKQLTTSRTGAPQDGHSSARSGRTRPKGQSDGLCAQSGLMQLQMPGTARSKA